MQGGIAALPPAGAGLGNPAFGPSDRPAKTKSGGGCLISRRDSADSGATDNLCAMSAYAPLSNAAGISQLQ
jgi:hypothetical protein